MKETFNKAKDSTTGFFKNHKKTIGVVVGVVVLAVGGAVALGRKDQSAAPAQPQA